uniref:CENP-T/Histone H4 histone fold domain-containing protein n=1 Tax=Naja naja TaxID=35670 RepID=A0A8C6Y1K2_NAJNA
MASRRSLRTRSSLPQQPEEEPQRRRRSLRLARGKTAPFSYQRSLAYQAPANSAQLDVVTPRTVFKKVLQTQPIVSPLVSEKPDSPKPVDTSFNFPVKLDSSSLEVSLSDFIQNQKYRIARHTTRSKKVRVSEFERDLNNQLHSSTAQALLDNTSLSKSLQISFTTPAPLNSAGKKGLIRRPKSYHGINLKDFEGGLEQDLLQIKDSVNISQSPRVATPNRRASGKTPRMPERIPFKAVKDRTNPQTGDRNRTKEMRTVETEQILEFEAEDNTEAVDISQSPRVATRSRRASGKTPKTLERIPFKAMRDRTNPQTGDKNRTKEMRTVETEQILEFEAEDNPEVEMSESEDVAVEISQNPRVATPSRRASGKTPKTLERIPFKAMRDRTNPQTGDKNRIKEMRTVETEQILEFEAEDNPEVEMSESGDVAVDIYQSPRVATPNRCASGKTPKTLERTPLKAMRDRTNPQTGDKNRIKEMRTVETEQILEFEAEDNPEVEMSESGDVAVEISQNPRVATPSRRTSGKTPRTLERIPFKAVRDRTNPQTGDRTKEMNVETEQILEFEAEDNTEIEMSESEDVEPTGSTPAFVRAKAFQCTPLLSSPRVLKEVASGSPVRQNLVQRVPKPAKKARREKQEPSLPSTLVKKMFTHYVKMPVTKEALQVVDRCVNVYFKHLSNDLEAYTNHARRKTAEPADLELLMRRQGLITDKMPLTLAFGVQEAANPYRHKWEQSDPSEAEVRSRTAWMPETEHFTFGNKPWRKMIS